MDGQSNNAAFEPTEPLSDDATTSRPQESVEFPASGYAANQCGCDRIAGTRSAPTDLRR